MNPASRPLGIDPRPVIVAALGLLTVGYGAASAQTPPPRPPAEVPYLNFPPPFSSAAPPADPAPAGPASLDALRQRDQELAAIRAEQRRTLENEAKLKREIEVIGDDRRKF